MASILTMRALPAWVLFAFGVSIPSCMLELAAEETARGWDTQIREFMLTERAQSATEIRGAFDDADREGKKTLESIPATATEAEAIAMLSASAHPFASPFAFNIEKDQINVVGGSRLSERYDEVQELQHNETLHQLARGDLSMNRAEDNLSFNLKSGPYVTAHVLRGDLTVGWIVDDASIQHGAAPHLPNNFILEPAPIEAEGEITDHLVVGVSYSRRETTKDDAGIEVDAGKSAHAGTGKKKLFSKESMTHLGFAYLPTTYRVALKPDQAAELDSFLGKMNKGVFGTVSACLFALVVFAASLFWRARGAQQLADLRTDFVAAVSHELRTPLASVRMFAELLEAGEVAEDEREEVQLALAGETRRLNATLDRMLRFGSLSRGKLEPQKSKQKVAPVVREAAERAKVPVEVDVDPDLEANIDGGLIGLALDNLLSNAKKYAPDGGPYAVRVRAEKRHVLIDVADRGPGLGWRARRLIWKPFERADARLSKATEGSGVGLALVRGIAEAHGGKATVQSRPGQGSTFTLRLPRA